ncbi:MAG: polysaccharide deacetylase family protein [Syntrophobacteraceae bacterium]
MILKIIAVITFISLISASMAAALLAILSPLFPWEIILIWFLTLMVSEAILGFGVFERRSPIFGPVFWKGEKGRNIVALTFDDGPNEPFTSQILDILKERQVRATFFVTGVNCRRFPGVLKRLQEDGHEIANHTLTHEVLPLKPPFRIEEEIRKTSDIIEMNTGKRPTLFRAPHGWRNPWTNAIARKCGCIPVAWTLGVWDTDRPGAEVIARRTLRGVSDGCVILLHDGRGVEEGADSSQLVEALPLIIDELHRRGFRPLTLSRMMEPTL